MITSAVQVVQADRFVMRSHSSLASARVLALLALRSRRQRRILGKRTASPHLWRLDSWMPSKPISNTNSGSTDRVGPNRSGVAPDPAIQFQNFCIVEAGVGLGKRHQLRVSIAFG